MSVTITRALEFHNPYALDLTAGSVVTLPNAMLPTGNYLSVEFYYYGELHGTLQQIIDASNATETQLDIQLLANGNLQFDCGGDGAGLDSLSVVVTSAQWAGWNHWAFVKDAAAGYLYIYRNFALFGSEITVNTTAISAPTTFSIPASAKGKITELRFWSDVRSQAEIEANVFIQPAVDAAGLVAYYKFEEKTGTTLGDATSNNHDGTIATGSWVAGFPNQGSGWEVITADLLPDYGFSHYQGLKDTVDPRNRLAQLGKLNAALNNSVKNSAATKGYYSPEHSSCRDGFKQGAGIRVKYTYSGTTRIWWQGRIYNIDPDPELRGTNITKIEAYDWIFEAAKQFVSGLTVQTDKRGDQAITSVVGIMPLGKRPAEIDLDTGVETNSYMFDTERDERTKIAGVLRRVTLTEFGRVTMSGRKLLFLNRHAQVTETTVQYDFDDAAPGVKFKRTNYPENAIYTRVKAKSHPRKIDALKTTVLATMNNAILIGVGVTEKVIMRYRDPDNVARISAVDLHDSFPEESVDYVAKANEDGTGTDLSSSLTVAIVKESANSVELSIYNGGTQVAYTGGTAGVFQVRGQGMYRFDPILSESVSSQETLDNYGDRELEYDLPYGDNPLTADGYSTYILNQTQVPRLDIDLVEYWPEINAGLAAMFIGGEMAERVTCARSMLGLDDDFFITFMKVDAVGRRIKCSYGVEPAASSAYLKLNDTTYAELGADVARLAF